MATKKSIPGKKKTQKAPAKKAFALKDNVKKVSVKKITVEKNSNEKESDEKEGNKKITLKSTVTTTSSASIVALQNPSEIPADTDCMCMQKKPNGNFYNFTLQQGRWVQSSAIPFPTKEACEEACC
jgi:hypothetical protein